MALTVSNAKGNENTSIALNIKDTVATDVVTISGVPAGWTLTQGVDNGNNTWTVAATAVPYLAITPPIEWDGTLTLSINSASFPTPKSLTVTVDPVAEAPSLSTPATLEVSENGSVALNIVAAPGAADDVLSVKIAGLP